MKAAAFYDIDDIRCEEMDVPSIGAGEILVKVMVCGLCGTDVSKMKGKTVPTPAILGHEAAGEVVEAGEGVKKFSKGDRVVVTHHLPCFVCRYCRHGNYSQCDAFKQMNIVPGGFAEYIRVLSPAVEKSVFKIPSSVTYEEASFTETAACCLRGIERCGILAGDTVMIVGAGAVGLLHLQLAKICGAGRVIVSDPLNFRLDTALRLGADAVVNPLKETSEEVARDTAGVGGADVVIIAVGNVDAVKQGLSFVSKGGKVLFFAGCPENSVLEFDPNLVYHSEISLLGSYSSSPIEQRAALRLIKERRINLKELVTHRFRLDQLQDALNTAIDGKESLKIIIKM